MSFIFIVVLRTRKRLAFKDVAAVKGLIIDNVIIWVFHILMNVGGFGHKSIGTIVLAATDERDEVAKTHNTTQRMMFFHQNFTSYLFTYIHVTHAPSPKSRSISDILPRHVLSNLPSYEVS
jgi:hypothetical protein